MKQISARVFFTILWGGVCQALGWFFGLFGYKRDGKLAKCIWGLFATSGAIVMAFFALALVCAGVEVVYDWYYKPHYCDDEYCYHSPDGVNATRPRGSNARGFSNIRRANKISPTAAQGKVANIAREQAKEYLRQHQPFVWNATNITAQSVNRLSVSSRPIMPTSVLSISKRGGRHCLEETVPVRMPFHSQPLRK